VGYKSVKHTNLTPIHTIASEVSGVTISSTKSQKTKPMPIPWGYNTFSRPNRFSGAADGQSQIQRNERMAEMTEQDMSRVENETTGTKIEIMKQTGEERETKVIKVIKVKGKAARKVGKRDAYLRQEDKVWRSIWFGDQADQGSADRNINGMADEEHDMTRDSGTVLDEANSSTYEPENRRKKSSSARQEGSQPQTIPPWSFRPEASKPLPLLLELFPEERNRLLERTAEPTEIGDLPRLKFPQFEALGDLIQDQAQLGTRAAGQKVKTFSYREKRVTILVLSAASNSLIESDFSRIISRGDHIKKWRSVGNMLKGNAPLDQDPFAQTNLLLVIPGRDPETLEPRGYYFLIFPNQAHALAYRQNATHLHNAAYTHTPKNIESQIAPPPGVTINGEDIHTQIKHYTLKPPVQSMSLWLLDPPFSETVKGILYAQGYRAITQPTNKTARSVLLWVSGYRATTSSIHTMLKRDGLDRGLQWSACTRADGIEELNPQTGGLGARAGNADEKRQSPRDPFVRWVVALADETEARRLVRLWHRRPYTFPEIGERPARGGEPLPLVHAEILW
jgi:hypothetical protein